MPTRREVNHRRLAPLCVVAAQCHAAGPVDDAAGYLEASQQIVNSGGFDEVPEEIQTSTGVVCSHAGQSERWVDLCRGVIAAAAGPHTTTRACLLMAFYFLGENDEARMASGGLLTAADAPGNPNTACFALLAHGIAYQKPIPSPRITPYSEP